MKPSNCYSNSCTQGKKDKETRHYTRNHIRKVLLRRCQYSIDNFKVPRTHLCTISQLFVMTNNSHVLEGLVCKRV